MGILGGTESAGTGTSSGSSSSSAGNSQTTENSGTSGGTNSGGTSGGTNSGSNSGSTPTWRDSLPDDLKANPLLAQFSDVGNLAKSYVNAQAMVGKKGVIVPGEKSTPEEQAQFYKELGLPDLDKYEIKAPQGMTVNDQFMKDFKESAHKSGVLPKQAQGLLEWYLGKEKEFESAQKVAKDNATQEGLKGLKQEWGQGYDKQIALGDMALRELGGDAFIAHVVKTGLSKDPAFIKLMAKVGGVLGEDKLRGEDFRKFGSETPRDIQAKIDGIMGDPKSPYFDPTHPGHRAVVDKMAEYFKKLHE